MPRSAAILALVCRKGLEHDLVAAGVAAIEPVEDADHVEALLGRDRRWLVVQNGVGVGGDLLLVPADVIVGELELEIGQRAG